jgi:hypothetical protein
VPLDSPILIRLEQGEASRKWYSDDEFGRVCAIELES